jgi:hypothetical protein
MSTRDEQDQDLAREVRLVLSAVLAKSSPKIPGYLALGIRTWVSHSESRFTDVSVDGLTVSGIELLQEAVHPDHMFVVDRALLRFVRDNRQGTRGDTRDKVHLRNNRWGICRRNNHPVPLSHCFPRSISVWQTVIILAIISLVSTASLVVGVLAGNPSGTIDLLWTDIVWKWIVDPISLHHTCVNH